MSSIPMLVRKAVSSQRGKLLVCDSMDDFLTIYPNPQYISDLFEHLSSKYKIKRLGPPQMYLNGHIIHSPNGSIHIFQPHTITAILQKLQMFDCNPKHTPLPEKPYNHLPSIPTALSAHMATLFRQKIGDIRYIADSTRPDIFHATNRLAAVMHNPTNTHLHQMKWLHRYLKHTLLHGILFKPQPTRPTHTLQTYSDADYANSPDRKSYTGVVHMYCGAPISWTSSKRSVVALSTCEAEYLAALTAIQQTNWLRRLIPNSLSILTKPTPLHIDNTASIQITNNTAPIKRRELIDIRHHQLHANLSNGTISIHHIPSQSNLGGISSRNP